MYTSIHFEHLFIFFQNSEAEYILSEDEDNSIKDPLYVLPSSEDFSMNSLEKSTEEEVSSKASSLVIPPISTINWVKILNGYVCFSYTNNISCF